MLATVRAARSQLRLFLQLSRDRGHSTARALLLHLPREILGRAWRKIAGWVNAYILAPTLCVAGLMSFHRRFRAQLGGHFYVIVMPGTLHYLVPCLRQLPRELQVILLFNGAARWERKLLRQLFPALRSQQLITLPFSSLGHGEVITLLLRTNERDFGLLDHDLYVYRPDIFQHMSFGAKQCMKAAFSDYSQAADRDYPHTWLVFFNTAVLKGIMSKYRITAGSYRRPPASVTEALATLGLGQGAYIKDYLSFYDTLHLLLALAWYEGLEVGYMDIAQGEVSHLGGTSMGSSGTKSLPHLYTSLRFLEYVDDPELNRRYLPRHAPFASASEVEARLKLTPETVNMRQGLDFMLEKLG